MNISRIKRNSNKGGAFMSEYFDMKSDKWKTTVKWCLRMGVALGLIIGGKILYKIL